MITVVKNTHVHVAIRNLIFVSKQEKSQLDKQLSGDISDHHRRQLVDELERVEEKISACVSEIQFDEGRIQDFESEIAKTRGGAEERQRKEGE